MNTMSTSSVAAVAALTVLSTASRADEGMWLFSKPPTKQIQAKYGFELTPQWLDHVQKSSVRISTGGSGSIVSSNGLVMTNHHVGSDMIEKLSTAEKNYLRDGFYAAKLGDEIPCPDMEINVLWTIQDVTQRVNESAPSSMSLSQQVEARRNVIAEIQKEAGTDMKSEVVTLYQGGRYHLYQYKRYTDVRLVMAPEKGIAFFGGDPDNFEFPRFNLDVCFFRIYVDGKPLNSAEHHLRWSRNGASDGDLVFVTGHPGRTERLNTSAHLEFMRDVQYPLQMRNVWRREVQLENFSGRGEEFRRIAEGDLFGLQNTRKVRTGIFAGLQDPNLIAQKQSDETELRKAVAANPEWEKQWGDAWTQVEAAKRVHADLIVRMTALGGTGLSLGGSAMFAIAKDLMRLADEAPKPNGTRLSEYSDARKASFELALYSPAPIHAELEVDKLASGIELMVELLGGKDPTVVKVLAGKAPRQRAEELIRGSQLADVAVRKRVASGGKDAITSSSDPLIQLARSLDDESRALRKRFEEEVDAREKSAYAKIAAAKFAKYGEDLYPDATFTLRLAYGAVKGWEQDGKHVAPFTNFAGLYERANERGNAYPFEIPKRWLDAKSKLNLNTPFNFVATCDIIGGNSGSPMINRAGEVVGLVFDGNIQSLVGNLIYDETQNRAVMVDSRAIVEALRAVYGMKALADEIVGAGA